jgi:branched-chain amino acid transport system permease protein
MDLSLLPQYTVNALTLGAIYALLALGYTMVYGIIRLINIPHGDVYMLGAFFGFGSIVFIQGIARALPSVVLVLAGLAAAMALCAFVGMAIERLVYRPVRTDRRTGIAELVAAIGVSLVLQNSALAIWGPNRLRFPPIIPVQPVEILGARLSISQVLILLLSALLMVALDQFVRRTRLGMAMRASASDPPVARLMGIDVERVILVTFAFGSALAGIAGILVAAYYGSFYIYMGTLAGLKAFTAAVMGGIGNLPGAMLGGLLLGALEVLGTAMFPAEWKDVFAFVALVLLLTLRPTGILGERVVNRG